MSDVTETQKDKYYMFLIFRSELWRNGAWMHGGKRALERVTVGHRCCEGRDFNWGGEGV